MRQEFKNAMAIIKQIKAGEWVFQGHHPFSHLPHFKCYTAARNGVELWVANGAFSCGVRDKPQELGIFGILVWYMAARKEVLSLERRMRKSPTDLTI